MKNIHIFSDRINEALQKLRPGDYTKIKLVGAKDGSGVGAAIIAAAALSKSSLDRFGSNVIVPGNYKDTGHPDLEAIQPRQGSDDPRMSNLIVPKNYARDRIFTVDELVGFYRTEGQKRVIVENDPAMTYVSGHALTSIMEMAKFKYTIGLATGGTTEALRKLMGLRDMLMKVLWCVHRCR